MALGLSRIAPENFGFIDPQNIAPLNSATIRALTTAQMAAFTTDQFVALTSDQIPNLSTAAIKAMTTAQMRAIEVQDLQAMTSQQIRVLATSNIGVLSSEQIVGLTAAQVGALTSAQIRAFAEDQVPSLEVTDLTGVSTVAMRAWTTKQIVAMTSDQIAGLTTTQIAALTTAQVAAIETQDIPALTVSQMGALTTVEMRALTTDQLRALTLTQVRAIEPRDITALLTNQVIALSAQQIGALSNTQASAFTAGQLAVMSGAQLDAWLSTPIVLDLNGDGVRTLGMEAGVQFDLFATHQPVHTGWVSGSDGLLVLDRNSDGKITDGSELFGSSTRLGSGDQAPDGYAALREFDTNHDGVISAADSVFNNLRIWADANSNGNTDAGELKSLQSLDIAQISLDATEGSATDSGNLIGLVSSYETSDGVRHAAADVWFKVDASPLAAKVSDMAQSIRTFQEVGDVLALASTPLPTTASDRPAAVPATPIVFSAQGMAEVIGQFSVEAHTSTHALAAAPSSAQALALSSTNESTLGISTLPTSVKS